MRHWLQQHPFVGWLLSIGYLITVTLTHDVVQRPALRLQRAYGVELVHYVLIILIVVSLVVMIRKLLPRLRDHENSRRMIWSGIVLLGAATLVLKFLMVRSIESIHILQYLILSLTLCILTRSPVPAVLLATLGGVFDEGWQYFVLHPGQPYFDFNDVIMNTVGALSGVWVYLLYKPATERVATSWKPALVAWAGLAVVIVSLFASGMFTVYRADSGIPFHRRVPPTEEKPVRYFNSNKWGNSWVRLHPFVGIGLTLLLPLGVLVDPTVRNKHEE